MALIISTGKGRLTVYVNNSEDGREYRVFSGKLGKVLDKSRDHKKVKKSLKDLYHLL